MGDAQGRLVEAVAAEGRIGVVVDTHGVIDLVGLVLAYARTIIMNTRRLPLVNSEHQRGLRRVHKHVLGTGRLAQGQGKDSK